MYIYIPTKWGSIHLSYELLGMLVGSVGKAFAIVLGRPGFESPHHHFQQEARFIFFYLCSQRACFSVTARPCRCRGDRRRRWTHWDDMIWYHIWYHKQYHIICIHDIIHDIMIRYHVTYHYIWYMISCWFSMISYTQIIWYSVHLASLWYHRFFHDIIYNIIVDIILWYHRYDLDNDIILRTMIS